MLAPGIVVADKYRLERVLGRGGMGMVVEARHVQLGTSFALKFLYNSILAKASLRERFFREARATAALKNEHVCRVFDVGEFQSTPYIVMERLEGTDLAKVLRQETRVPLRAACDYLIQACAGLAEAHAAKIVHRDLKPGNLFVTERADGTPLVKLLDFGIAKAPQEDNLELTGTYTILGSPSYMSLEQLRSSKLVDTRSDIWSLGVILFELVSGRKPFVGDSVADLALKIAMDPAPRLPEGPAVLDDIIARCLAHDPARRYQGVGELSRALAQFADEPARRLAASIGRALRGSAPVAVAPGGVPGRAATSPAAPIATPSAIPTRAARPAAMPSAISTARVSATPAVAPSTMSPPSPGESPKPALATTMQTAGAIESSPATRGPHRRVGVIVMSIGMAVGICLGIAASGEGEPRSTAPPATHFVEPAAAAPPLLPSLPPPISTPPVIVPDAAVAAPEDDPAIELEPAHAAAPPLEPSPPPPPPKRRSRTTKPSTQDLGQSRI